MSNYYSSLSTSKANSQIINRQFSSDRATGSGLLVQSWKECIHFAEEQERLVYYLSIYIL